VQEEEEVEKKKGKGKKMKIDTPPAVSELQKNEKGKK